MAKHINIEQAIEIYRKSLEQNKSFVSMLQKLPSVDIVRCKECKHCLSEEIEETMPIYIYCDLWQGETEWDSFCSYGERIDNEQP